MIMNFQQYDIRLEKKDFFPKIFLKPQEIKLEKQKGLVVIKRTEDHPDKFEEEDIMDIQTNPEELEGEKRTNPAGHGLLSLFKKTGSRKIRLAICVSVFSQTKHMLKTTIKGIQESYKHFFEKAGIMSHEIILVCIFDGIEKINSSRDQTENMISYFNEFDYKNGFKQQPYSKQFDEYVKYVPEDDDISIFTEEELEQLKPKLFDTQYQNYTRFKKLLSDIQSIYIKKEMKEINEIRLDDLPPEVLKRYERLCNNYVVYNNIILPNINDVFEEIQDYFSHRKDKRLKLILEALKEVELLCVQYLKSRQDTSILYPLRIQASDLDGSRKKYVQEIVTNQPQKPPEYNYMFFCVKHKNAGKLSSHLLFFEGFCKLFDPQFCILLDVGLMPQKDAIYRMWNYMQKNPQCGGVCGYMGLKIENPSDDYGYRMDGFQIDELDHLTKTAEIFTDLQRAQQFEYHFAHMLDKPSEAAFNYIHVLPGAFSGYRCKALKSIPYGASDSVETLPIDDARSERPLSAGSEVGQSAILVSKGPKRSTIMSKYLKTAMNEGIDLTLQQSNMYLAEDRVMCLGIHTLGYDLAYLPDAQSIVDPITSLTRMMGQRKRWINGSWFAFQYVFSHKSQRLTCLFIIQLMHYWLVEKISYLSISIFYICLNLTVTAAVKQYIVPAVKRFFGATNDWQLAHYKIGIFDVKSVSESIPHIINFVYLVCIGALFFLSLSLNHANKRFSRIYYYVSSLLGFYGLAMLALLIYNAYQIIKGMVLREPTSDFIIPVLYYKILILLIIAGHAIPILWTFSFRKYFEMMISLISYLFYTPTYIHVLTIFSFCRIDDLAWGTKGLDQDRERQKALEWKIKKLVFVAKYLFINLILGYVVMEVIHFQTFKNVVILVVTCLVSFLLIWRLFFAAVYLIKYQFKKCSLSFSADVVNQNIRRGSQVLAGLNTIQRRIREIEKNETKIKKQIQLKDILDRSKIGNKVQGKILAYISDNNMVPTKEITLRNQKYKSRRKIVPLKNKLKTIEEVSNESQSIQNSIKQKDSRQRVAKDTKDPGYRSTKDVIDSGSSQSHSRQQISSGQARQAIMSEQARYREQRQSLVPSVPRLSGSHHVDLKTKIERIKSMKQRRKSRLEAIREQSNQ